MATSPFAAPLSPVPQYFDNNGAPLNAGTIRIDQAGTTTLDSIYPTQADALAGSNPIANPFTLDSAGRGEIWLQAGRLYKITVRDSAAVLVETLDGFSPAAAYPYPALDQFVRHDVAPVFSTTVLFTQSGDTTAVWVAGRRFKALQTSGTIYGTVSQSSHAAGTTTVRVITDSGVVLDSGLNQIFYGLPTPTYQGVTPSATGDRMTWVNAYRNANQALTIAIWNKIVFDTEQQDNLSEWDTVNSRFTPLYQSNATYQQRWRIHGQVTFDTSIVSAQIGIALNGTTPPAVTIEAENLGIAGAVMKFDYTIVAPATTGNFWEVWVNPIAGVNARGGIAATFVQVERLQG